MLSRKIQNINPSLTVELNGKIAELRKSGYDIISFSVGEPDFGTPVNIGEVGKAAIDQNKTKYTAVAGVSELREAICEKLKMDNNVSYTPSEISVGTGAKQPLFNAVFTICDEGDEVLLPTPCWVSYIEMIKLSGATPVLVPCKEENGFMLDIEAISKAITPRTKAILINTPNNPTGAVYTEGILTELAKMACEHDFYIISDEVYEKLVYNEKKHFCVASISEGVKKRTIVINGFSKAYSMTGWRMGYVAAASEIIKGINALQSHTTSNPSSIAQYASIEALAGPQDDLKMMHREFDKRRVFLVDRLNQMDGIKCANADGAFYLMPNVKSFYGKLINGNVIRDSFDLCNFLLEDAHISVVPGAAFESPENIRISYSNSMENLIRGMDQMEASLKKIR